MERWIGKVAVVTGASSGIGEAIAKTFVGAGINVLGLARRKQRLQTLSESLHATRGSFYPIRCDVRNEQDILSAFEYAEEHFGGTDILINNAGMCPVEPIAGGIAENMRAVLEVNVLAAALCSSEAIKSIRKRGTEGYIVNINSVLGLNATVATAPTSLYPASKFALRAMTENLRREIYLNKDKIKITSIYPGLVKTEILEIHGGDPTLYKKVPHIASKDIADSVMYALSTPHNVQIEEIKITPLHQKL